MPWHKALANRLVVQSAVNMRLWPRISHATAFTFRVNSLLVATSKLLKCSGLGAFSFVVKDSLFRWFFQVWWSKCLCLSFVTELPVVSLLLIKKCLCSAQFLSEVQVRIELLMSWHRVKVIPTRTYHVIYNFWPVEPYITVWFSAIS